VLPRSYSSACQSCGYCRGSLEDSGGSWCSSSSAPGPFLSSGAPQTQATLDKDSRAHRRHAGPRLCLTRCLKGDPLESCVRELEPNPSLSVTLANASGRELSVSMRWTLRTSSSHTSLRVGGRERSSRARASQCKPPVPPSIRDEAFYRGGVGVPSRFTIRLSPWTDDQASSAFGIGYYY